MATQTRPRRKLARNEWTREQESRVCRACGAEPGTQCVTANGTGAPLPHATRFNDALDAAGSDRYRLGEIVIRGAG